MTKRRQESDRRRPKKIGFWTPPTATERELRKFGLLFAFILVAVAIFLWYRENPVVYGVGLVGLFFAIASLVPTVLLPFYIVWMMFARILGFINSHILLAIVFYTLVTIVGFIMRIVRYDPLNRRPRSAGSDTFWVRRETTALPGDHYEHQF